MSTILTSADAPSHWAGLTVLAVYEPAPLVQLPVVTATCWYCSFTVALAFQDTYTVSRVSGDSRYGYEPCHNACADDVAADEDQPGDPLDLMADAREDDEIRAWELECDRRAGLR